MIASQCAHDVLAFNAAIIMSLIDTVSMGVVELCIQIMLV